VSSNTSEPDKVTVEDLFRAKERWRKEQAKLPFEMKIEILETLKEVAAQVEKSNRRIRDHKK
jgi:hypothetical protein